MIFKIYKPRSWCGTDLASVEEADDQHTLAMVLLDGYNGPDVSHHIAFGLHCQKTLILIAASTKPQSDGCSSASTEGNGFLVIFLCPV